MTTLPIYGGPLKRDVIQRAHGYLGRDVSDSELTPEEYRLGLMVMNDIAATMPTMPYNPPLYQQGDGDEESGLAFDDVLGFTSMLAQNLGQTIGKAFAPNKLQANAASALIAKYQVVNEMSPSPNNPIGSGYRYGWQGPFSPPVY